MSPQIHSFLPLFSIRIHTCMPTCTSTLSFSRIHPEMHSPDPRAARCTHVTVFSLIVWRVRKSCAQLLVTFFTVNSLPSYHSFSLPKG